MHLIRRILKAISSTRFLRNVPRAAPPRAISVLVDRFPSEPGPEFESTPVGKARAALLDDDELKHILSNDGWDRRGIVKPLWATNGIDGGLRVSCHESSNPLLAILIVTSAIKSLVAGDEEVIYGMISIARALTREKVGEKLSGSLVVEALKLSVLHSECGEGVVVFAVDEGKGITRHG